MSEKTKVDELKEQILMNDKNAGLELSDAELQKADEFCEGYKNFLNVGKTEREVTAVVENMAIEKGFVRFNSTRKYPSGSRVYLNNRDKSIILAVIGKKSVKEGVRISAAHIDSPRLDLKPNPLYEESELAYFKTHYYGGIKKYQWTAIPLSLHGVVITKDGESVKICLGEEAGEPQFVVTDLLPHLASEQMKRPLSEGIKGEELNILIGSRPFKSDSGSELVKLNIMKLINEKYGITEKDFLSAELELVPAFKASDIGFDRSMIGSYGHDDRVCAYPAAMAIFDIEIPEYTAITVLTDKEEIGSQGNTGLKASYLKDFIADLAHMDSAYVSDVLRNSECLSADVNSAYDPTFSDAFEKKNSSYLNYGVVVTKYTGARGKSDTSDASAEYMGKVRRIFDSTNVRWQIGELGKVDIGGGGTVAKYIANMNVDTIDVGVPVMSMHSPFEVVSKIDVYMAYRAFCEFFKAE